MSAGYYMGALAVLAVVALALTKETKDMDFSK